MKSRLPFFLLLLCSFSLNAQFLTKQLFVAASALKLRQEPNRTSKVLATMTNGEPVQLLEDNAMENSSLYDQIDSIQGRWVKVQYKDKSGYAFSPYLATRYNLFYEFSYAEYLPKVNNWYGVYKKANGEEEIRAIQVELRSITRDEEEGGETHMYLYTNQRDTSLLIIGTNEIIKPGYVGVFSKNIARNTGISSGLRAGDECWLYSQLKGNTIQGEHYQLFGTGEYKLYSYGLQLEHYKVMVAKRNPPNPAFVIIQDLTGFFSFIDGWVKVEWVGDLDRDGKPDVVIQSCSTQQCINYLFLSSEARENELLRPVSSYSWYDEC